MSLVVPFDGSMLSKSALVRAAQFDQVLDEGILVVSVIPEGNVEYARARGWIGEEDPFDADAIVSHLQNEVAEITPAATFQELFVDRFAPVGTIATRIRRFARTHDVSIAFIGSENAGRVVRAMTVGQLVATEQAYDTMIISNETLPEIEQLDTKLPADELRSSST